MTAAARVCATERAYALNDCSREGVTDALSGSSYEPLSTRTD